ncbi:hypothetical protein [Actinoplanes sp. NPDC026619]|uniref:hypothetical protein n=1 Tax=Actinoplanes sp. NPDC026619 TaxID=3155798 RepID=UPI0033E50061
MPSLSWSVAGAFDDFFSYLLFSLAATAALFGGPPLALWLYSMSTARRVNLPLVEANSSVDPVPYSVRVQDRERLLETLYRLSNGSISEFTKITVLHAHLAGMDAASLCRALAFLDDAKFVEWRRPWDRGRRRWNNGFVILAEGGVNAAKKKIPLDPESAAMNDLMDWVYSATRPVGTDAVRLSSARRDLPHLRHSILLTSLRLLERRGLVTFSPRDYELCEVGWIGVYERDPNEVRYSDPRQRDRDVRLTGQGSEVAGERALWKSSTSSGIGRADPVRPVVGWGMTESEMARTKMVEWLDPDSLAKLDRPTVGSYVKATGLSVDETRKSVEALMRQDLVVRSPIPLTGISELPLALTENGRAFAQSVRRARQSSHARRAACRDALLGWLYDQDGEADVTDFLPDRRATYFGVRRA